MASDTTRNMIDSMKNNPFSVAMDGSSDVHAKLDTLFEEEEEEEPDLIVRFQRYRHKNDGRYCQPKHERKSAHLSDLPLEIFMYILKWVVSADLDLKSLEQFSMVCRGFYLCSRDEEIWKLACLKSVLTEIFVKILLADYTGVWGIKCVKKFYTQSWRHMYLEKHHLRFNGCYISKTTYIRHGETSYIDETYRPWYLVEYYRYLRFFPEGKVLMLTTADNPYIALSKLHSRTPHFASVMVGHYRLYDNIVTAILKPPVKTTDNKAYRRRRRNQIDNDSNDSGQLTYHLELEVQHVKRRPNFKLVWNHYAVHTNYKSGQEVVANFDLSPNNFSPFWYSIVKSYSSMSEKPLM
ncbi:F-box only protein 9 [Nymphon striatum]|nr:F-box only protein 9 [Nymphon striatum]